jgi:hypothetical protein
LNSNFIVEQADHFAARLQREAGTDITAQVTRAFQLVFQRDPAEQERTAAEALVREHGLPVFCRALLNANEFLYLN